MYFNKNNLVVWKKCNTFALPNLEKEFKNIQSINKKII